MRCPMLPRPIQPIVSCIALYSWLRAALAEARWSRRRRNHHVCKSMALGDETGVLEDVEGHLESWLSDFHVRCPIAKLLVGGNRVCQHREVDVPEEGCLGFCDLGGG